MKYSKNSYEELNEKQAKLFFDVIKEIKEEILDGCKKGKKYDDFIKKGVSAETMFILKAGKFITWKNKIEPVWLSWTNEIYEDRTIKDLYYYYKIQCGYNID